ncbi:unnamed protein product [Vitrella brassicaformis CCMP3155]|uniref:PPPDE domain-containing protein n=1 Tax=Vitrella brassicaformis (strain CCMP3155) TaxID=1169540 RepID=A0A0G4EH84_VITBC|nr:unnamed protein product [Vitrella brassicaformis CCMP3155]|mmetsp:Transcript_10544/g.25585  ORF Transcript_10544/g.25585 Transcript_10544/m.25585 type:complete len:247 (-) Transcript_10544:198-938(-)|eukprot:CEL95380.1 unnamed protein product [Vitrella brassicaformis CCMP3155]
MPRQGSPIVLKLNVYDLVPQENPCCGLYHTGVEIEGIEYSFGDGAGVYECVPKTAPDGRFRGSMMLGETTLSRSEITSKIDQLRLEFKSDEYDLIRRNCNHFSDALSKAVLKRGIPASINRLAWWGQFCSCLLPPEFDRQQRNKSAAEAASAASQPSQPLFQGEGFRLGGGSEPASTNKEQKRPLLWSAAGAWLGGGGSSSGEGGDKGGAEKETKDRVDGAADRELRAKAALDRLEMAAADREKAL